MGMIINIDEALKLRTDYNVLKEPLHDMMRRQQEAWERENPIDFLFVRNTMNSFQETYTSSIGFAHAFTETSDYAVGPIFNTAEGFAATYRTRTFQGGFIITQQALEDRQYGKIKDDAAQFVKRWNGDVVEYSMHAILGGFVETTWAGGDGKASRLMLKSADTVDGDIMNTNKNWLFGIHKTVKREGDSGTPISQYNIYQPTSAISLTDTDIVPKVAELINAVITEMENYKDDNGKIAGVLGAKSIVCANDQRLKAILTSAVETDVFKAGAGTIQNLAYKRADVKTTPYLNDIVNKFVTTSGGSTAIPMFFIVDKSYNAENHGPELTERIPFTLEAFNHREAPQGIKYEGRQRFDINVATWRGIAAVFMNASGIYVGTTQINSRSTVSQVKQLAVYGTTTPVTVVGTVTTQAQQ